MHALELDPVPRTTPLNPIEVSRPLVVAISSMKGGAGKTTTATAFIEIASARGYRVAGLDADPQAALSDTLEPASRDVAGAKELLRAESGLTLADTLCPTSWGDLVSVVQAEPTLSNREFDLTAPAAERRLRDAIDADPGGLDLLVIDAPPGRSRLVLVSLVAADLVVIPTNASTYAATCALSTSGDLVPIARTYHPTLEVGGIVVTKWANRVEERRVADELSEIYGGQLIEPFIPRREVVARAYESLHMRLSDMRESGADAIREAYESVFDQIIKPRMKGDTP